MLDNVNTQEQGGPMPRSPAPLRMRSFRLSDSDMRKLERIRRHLARNNQFPVGISDALRHAIHQTANTTEERT